jgi:hypothetical protein
MLVTNSVNAASTPRRNVLSASALVVGGLLMVLMYVFQIIHGLNTGEMMTPENSLVVPVLRLSGLAFCAGLVGIAIGLAGIGLDLRTYSPKLATIGLALPLLAALAPALNLLLVLGITGEPTVFGPINGLSVLANLGGAALLGIAGLRSRALPRPISITLLMVGLITFPLILLTIPAEQFLPGYVVMDIPFPVWGAIFAGLGLALLRKRAA